MANRGPGAISAMTAYENTVSEMNATRQEALRSGGAAAAFPLVAIYPTEGTYWCDHPAGVVTRPWVDAAKRAGGERFLAFLLADEAQRGALAVGFRPADPRIAVAGPAFAPDRGVDPSKPSTTLPNPDANTIADVLTLWKQVKKQVDVVLVIDTSGSMKNQGRMEAARQGAIALIDQLAPQDRVSLIRFSGSVDPATGFVPMDTLGKDALRQRVSGLYPDGGTALYDAIAQAWQVARGNEDPKRISAVVVLTDGEDTIHPDRLPQLMASIGGDVERQAQVRIFTIACGAEANAKILGDIAKGTGAKTYQGEGQDIIRVFRDIATFF